MSEASRKKILNRLDNDTREEPESSSSGFHFLKTYNQPLVKTFEEKLTAVNGVFVYSKNLDDFKNSFNSYIKNRKWKNVYCIEESIISILPFDFVQLLTPETEVAVTGCEYLVAQTGSAIVSTTQTQTRRSFAYAPIHIIVAFKNQLIGQLEEGLNLLAEKYKNKLPSQITTITGPSRTADIEKTLVLGAHGPRELIIFYIDQ